MFLIQKHNFTYVYISKAGYIISWYVNIFLWKRVDTKNETQFFSNGQENKKILTTKFELVVSTVFHFKVKCSAVIFVRPTGWLSKNKRSQQGSVI